MGKVKDSIYDNYVRTLIDMYQFPMGKVKLYIPSIEVFYSDVSIPNGKDKGQSNDIYTNTFVEYQFPMGKVKL